MFACGCECRRFNVSGEDTAAHPGVCYRARVVPETRNRFHVVGFKATEWSGLQLLSHGTYTIRVEALGIASFRWVGNIEREDLVVDCRVSGFCFRLVFGW